MKIDTGYLQSILERLVKTPSPTGMTEDVVRLVCGELDHFGIGYEMTRRGAIRASLNGKCETPRRAVVVHLDTLGAMVNRLKSNGRLAIVPIGNWSARFAEGALVVVHGDNGKTFKGTVLPNKASGHRYNEEVDTQPCAWNNLEVRLDEVSSSLHDIWDLGMRIGDVISFDVGFQLSKNGFINSRHLDDKAGVAVLLAVVKALGEYELLPTLSAHLLFTISEEVGVGASHILRGDVAEMVSIDNGTLAPDQNTCEMGATIAMMDSSGPFDRHLTRHLITLAMRHEIEFSRDVFLHYRSDAAAALEAGNDIRTALLCFGLDASHGYERTHIRSLQAVTELTLAYLLSPPLFSAHENVIGPEDRYPMIPTSELRPG